MKALGRPGCRGTGMLKCCCTIAAGMCSTCWACTLETLEHQGGTAPVWWLQLALAWITSSKATLCLGWLLAAWAVTFKPMLRQVPMVGESPALHRRICVRSIRCPPMPAVVPLPRNLSFEEAATTPTVFITVDSAFRQAAAVRPSDRVLVHGAAGGVGLAAIQMVAALGGSTIATAGSSNKRALVRSLGARHVLGSRDTAFVSELAEVGGATVALNSLTSSGMVAGSLAALDAGGRFVEISKRDIWSAARVAQGKADELSANLLCA